MIENVDIKQNIEVTIKLSMNLSKETFNKLYEITKEKYEAELLTKKNLISQIFSSIKEICDAFSDIKFDISTGCFYNEVDEINKWGIPQGKNESTDKRGGCDCCNII